MNKQTYELLESLAAQDQITYTEEATLPYKQLASMVNHWRNMARHVLEQNPKLSLTPVQRFTTYFTAVAHVLSYHDMLDVAFIAVPADDPPKSVHVPSALLPDEKDFPNGVPPCNTFSIEHPSGMHLGYIRVYFDDDGDTLRADTLITP